MATGQFLQRSIDVGNAHLHTLQAGSGDALLFLVGLGGRCDFWRPTIETFSSGFNCLSFDHRKTGDSVPEDLKSLVEIFADDAIGLLDSLEIERAHIVGHSLGGAVAQHIAVHAPERVDKLVLSASWAGPTPSFLELFALRRDVLKNCGPRAYILQGNMLGNPGWWVMENFDAVAAAIDARVDSFAGVEIELRRMDAVTSHDLRGEVQRISAETMVICARDDSITPLPLSEELAAKIPRAKLEVLPAGNHFAPVTVTEDYTARLMKFLRP